MVLKALIIPIYVVEKVCHAYNELFVWLCLKISKLFFPLCGSTRFFCALSVVTDGPYCTVLGTVVQQRPCCSPPTEKKEHGEDDLGGLFRPPRRRVSSR